MRLACDACGNRSPSMAVLSTTPDRHDVVLCDACQNGLLALAVSRSENLAEDCARGRGMQMGWIIAQRHAAPLRIARAQEAGTGKMLDADQRKALELLLEEGAARTEEYPGTACSSPFTHRLTTTDGRAYHIFLDSLDLDYAE